MTPGQPGLAPPGQVTCPRPGCGKTLSRKQDIRRHIKDVHEVEKWRCPFPGCGYRGANRREKARKHIKDIHQDTRVFHRIEVSRPQPITQKQRELQLDAAQECAHSTYTNDQDPYGAYATAGNFNNIHSSNTLTASSSLKRPESNPPRSHPIRTEYTSLSSIPFPDPTVPRSTYGQSPGILRPEHTPTESSPRSISTSLPFYLWDSGGISSFSGCEEATERAMAQDSCNQDPQYTWTAFEQPDEEEEYYPCDNGSGI